MICIARRSARSAPASSVPRSVPSNTHAPGGRLDQAQHQPAEGGLAAARFADHAQRLAGLQREVDAVDRAHRAADAAEQPAPHREVLDQAVHVQQRRVAGYLVMRAPDRRSDGPAGSCGAPAGPGQQRVGVQRRLPAGRQVAAAQVDAAAARRGGTAHRRTGSARRSGSPAGRRSGLGTWPSIAARRRCSPCSRGIEPSRPTVYGCCGVVEQRAAPAPARRPARRTSPPPRRRPRPPRRGRA